jgi:hypothetical protein
VKLCSLCPSPLIFLIALNAAQSLSAQQPQNTGIPASAKWFQASPIGVQSSSTPMTQTEMEPMPLVAPIFIEDATTSSSLVIANNSAINAGATIVIRSLSGAEVGTTHRKLAPHEQLEISIQSLLTDFASPIVAGSITVTQDANLKGMTVASQLLLTEFRGSLPSYVDEELAMPQVSGSATLRGVADEAAGTALLAITSIVNWEQHVTLRCLSEKAEQRPAIITIAPYATSLVSSCSGQTVATLEAYTQGMSQRQGSLVQGYELVTDGGPGAIAAFSLAPHLRNQDVVFSAIPFTDPEEIHSPNSVFAGVPFGAQDALPNGVYEPRISFTNFAGTPAHITVSIAATRPGDVPVSAAPGESPEKVTIRQLTIAPRRTVELSLSDAVSQSGLLQSLFVESDKKPGEVLGKAVSRSDGNLFEVELLEKDQMDENNGGIHPWSVEGDSESHLLLFNYSDKPRTFSAGIWNGAILWVKEYTLAPNETREISINELIQDEVPDGKGQVLSPGYERGVVNWMVPDSGEGTGRLMVTSRSKGMARNFSCGNFIVVCGGYWYASSGLTVGETGTVYNFVPDYCDEFSPSQCSGGSQTGSGSGNFNWSVGSSGIVQLSSSSQQYVTSWPELYGVGSGGGYGNVEVTAGSCQVNGSGPVPVAPTIAEISPSIIPVGENTRVTITGAGFGTAPAVNLPTGVTSSGQTSTNTSINLTLSVPSNTAIGYDYITVTASGETSNPPYLVVLDGPYDMDVVSDITYPAGTGMGLCPGGSVCRYVNYQIMNFSGVTAGETNICEAPSLTSWSCTGYNPPGMDFAGCPSATYSKPSGQFTDEWSAGSITYPSGCGYNITDTWDWGFPSPPTPIGVLTGYIYSNAIEINGVTSPAQMAAGTPIPR